jgi:hypothetical protein
MGSLLSLILPALVPAFTDGFRGIFAKFTGGAGGQPQNVTERVQLMEAEAAKLQAMASLDGTFTGQPSQWIIDLRASFRYIIISAILIFTGVVVFCPNIVGASVITVFLDMSGCCMSFVIGERMYLSIKK